MLDNVLLQCVPDRVCYNRMLYFTATLQMVSRLIVRGELGLFSSPGVAGVWRFSSGEPIYYKPCYSPFMLDICSRPCQKYWSGHTVLPTNYIFPLNFHSNQNFDPPKNSNPTFFLHFFDPPKIFFLNFFKGFIRIQCICG